MTEQQDEHVWQPLPGRVGPQNHLSKVVEGSSEHTSGKPQGIETDVGEDVAKDSGGHIVGVPKTCSDVNQRVASRFVEYVDSEGGNHSNYDDGNLCRTFGKYSHHCQDSRDDASENEQKPSPGADILLESESLCVEQSLDCHRKADVEHTDQKGKYHLDGVT